MRKTFTHLCFGERFVIEKLLAQHTSVRGIALVLGRSPNTVAREIQKNSVHGRYFASTAKQKAYQKRHGSKRQCLKVAMNEFLARFVQEKLECRWSPKQMSGCLRNLGIRVSQKAIYKFVC